MKRDHAWLETYADVLKGSRVLELGCGPGIDSKVIARYAHWLVATDLDPNPQIECLKLKLDHSKTLPFKDASFDVVVASLCLHYFDLEKTTEVVAETTRVLKHNGVFICRVNSHKDVNHGAEGFPEIEPGLFAVRGEPKRFFQEHQIQALWSGSYDLGTISLKGIDRYQQTKYVYEFSGTCTTF